MHRNKRNKLILIFGSIGSRPSSARLDSGLVPDLELVVSTGRFLNILWQVSSKSHSHSQQFETYLTVDAVNFQKSDLIFIILCLAHKLRHQRLVVESCSYDRT